jgi:NAD(P)-dependent dehydrogenase (short-subunit alcohol dehydrogenase family)
VAVTGAGSGIGRAIALAFAGRLARLHLTDLREERLEEVAREARIAGAATVCTHVVDSRQPAQVDALAAAVYAQDKRVDVLCNNAGVGHSALAQDMPLDTWREVIDTNLIGVVHGVVAFLPRLLAQEGRSHVVNTASVAGLLGLPGLAAYCASKFGVVGLTEALAVEVAPEKIRFTAVCPGIINTNIVKDSRILAMGAVDQANAIGFYERYGADPSRVAADVIHAVECGVSLQLSAPGPYGWLWRLKRISGALYERVGRWMGRQALSRGLPGGVRSRD